VAKKANKAKKATRTQARRTVKKASKPVARTATKKAAKKTAAKKTAAKKTAAKKSAPATRSASRPVSRAAAKPSGSELLSVTAGFTANDAQASIDWYCNVLGFKVIERWEYEGRFMGGRVGSGQVSFNIGQDDWKLGRDRIKGQATRMYILMGPDIDAYVSAIKARGGVLSAEPKDDWGLRAFSIDDPDGFKLTFMTPLSK
jgi:catechol 2,3-dioxygenase-like lactoylglutathione lyase family enzyme